MGILYVYINNMRKNLFFICTVLLVLFIFGRYYYLNNEQKQIQKPEHALIGTYEGLLPCADCEGIQTTLNLYENPPTFTLGNVYVGTSTVFDEKGTWTTTTNSSNETIYVLTPTDSESKMYFLKGDGEVTQLDAQMQKIDSNLNFTLKIK